MVYIKNETNVTITKQINLVSIFQYIIAMEQINKLNQANIDHGNTII